MTQKIDKQKVKKMYLGRDFARYLGEFAPLVIDEVLINSLAGLLEFVQSQTNEQYVALMKQGVIYAWLKDVVKDAKLARQIRNIYFKNNFMRLLTDRLAEIKAYARHPEKSFAHHELELYVEKNELVCNLDLCVGCGTCVQVCPLEALELVAPVGAKPEAGQEGKSVKALLQISDKCSLCSMCVAFCPTGALNFYRRGQLATPIQEENRMPQLPGFGLVNGVRVREYWTGSIGVMGDCPEECTCQCNCQPSECAETCVSVCPTGAIKRFDDKGFAKHASIDESKCILCGACARVCPDELIKLTKVNIKCQDQKFSGAWTKALERMISKRKVNYYHGDKANQKLADLARKTGRVKYEM